MSYPRAELTPVINLGLDEMVLIPLQNALVVQQANIRHDDILNMMVIDGASYNELQSTLSLPAASEDEVKNYFIKCCNDAIGYGYPTLSDKAYGIIYNEQVDAGDSIKSMITNLGRILTSYHEDEPKHILSNADLYKLGDESDKRSDDEFLAAAISSIAESDYQSYLADYMNGDVQVILYSAG